jgi:hypothetical protein
MVSISNAHSNAIMCLASWKEFQKDHQSTSNQHWQMAETTNPLTLPFAEYITQVGFYMILEIGIALVAVCLPSIWSVFTTIGPDKIMRSIRSVVSLASVRSLGPASSRGSQHQSAEAQKSAVSISSATPLPLGESSRLPSLEDTFNLDQLRRSARADARMYVRHGTEPEFLRVEHGNQT